MCVVSRPVSSFRSIVARDVDRTPNHSDSERAHQLKTLQISSTPTGRPQPYPHVTCQGSSQAFMGEWPETQTEQQRILANLRAAWCWLRAWRSDSGTRDGDGPDSMMFMVVLMSSDLSVDQYSASWRSEFRRHRWIRICTTSSKSISEPRDSAELGLHGIDENVDKFWMQLADIRDKVVRHLSGNEHRPGHPRTFTAS